jgi:lipopolysaccharide export system permease protein
VSLISRYVLRETIGAWVVVTLVLFVILMGSQFAQILGQAAANELPKDAVFAILGLTALTYLTLLTPIGLFLAVMLALARLNRDSEMAALSACGVGPVSLLRPIGLLTILLSAGLAWLALVQTPGASRRIEQIRFQAQESLDLGVLEAGKFTTPDSGKTILYARDVAGDEIRDVFLQRQDGDRVTVILAERGERIEDRQTGKLSFVLYNGRRYEGIPGQRNFRVVKFAEHGIPIRLGAGEEFVEPAASKSTRALMRSSDPTDQAEFQWRISSPVSLFVLVLLAVPLSRSRPREGRYARLGLGLLIYIIYVNLLSIGQVWIESNLVPTWLGLWWVHALMALIGLWVLGREAGWFTAPRQPAGAGAT